MYFTFIENIESPYQEILDANKKFLGDAFIIFREYPYELPKNEDFRWKSDVARCVWMKDHPNDIWIDADTLVLKQIDFEIKKPLLYNIRGQLDICVMIGNGNPQPFEEMLKHINSEVGWAQYFANSHRDMFDTIPNGYFDHKALHLLRKSVN